MRTIQPIANSFLTREASVRGRSGALESVGLNASLDEWIGFGEQRAGSRRSSKLREADSGLQTKEKVFEKWMLRISGTREKNDAGFRILRRLIC